MSLSTTTDRFYTYRRTQRGQTLIVALAILFLLLFIGGLFVSRIGRNLVTAGRSRDTSDAQALAQAGLDYCNTQLNTTPEGADWRPVPTPPMSNNDPDFYYLERGFARVPLKGGRALVRVAYDPHPTNPSGQALRIESVGLPGELPVNGSDPTVFITAASGGHLPRLRRELVAYKQFGLLDYGLFITNKDRRSDPNFLGTPTIGNAVATVFGNPMLGYPAYSGGISKNEVLYGFPMRVNGNVVFGSDTYIYLSRRGQTDPTLFQEKVLIGGTIDLLSQHRTQAYSGANIANDLLYPAYVNQEIDQAPNMANAIRASNDTNLGFTTDGGLVRDSSNSPDTAGYVRSVSFQSWPSLDTLTGAGVLRYRAATRDSGMYYTDPVTGQSANTGQYGYGTGIYINNDTDRQVETQTPGVNGSYSQRADWLNPNAGFAQNFWNGPFYRPPGVIVELLGDRIRLTRSDDKSFINSNGNPNQQGDSKTLIIPLNNLDRSAITLPGNIGTLAPLPNDGDTANNPNSPFTDKSSYGVSVVLFAEGNIRVKGVYGALTDPTQTTEQNITQPDGSVKQVRKLGRVHLTLVSGGTAYIEGNLVRGDGFINSGGEAVMERGSTCAILAKDYVCINSTMFMQPQSGTSVWSRLNSDLQGFGNEIGQSEQRYDSTFSWGVNPGSYTTNGGSSPVWLFMRHGVLGASNSLAAINLLVNPGLVDPTANAGQPGNYLNSLYLFNEYGAGLNGYLPERETYLLGEKFFKGNAVALQDSVPLLPSMENKAFPLYGTLHNQPIDNNTTNLPFGVLPLITTPGYTNTLRIQIDQTVQALLSGQSGNGGALSSFAISPYVLGSLMVAPLDIRIEAALYAQEKSFFIIPGYALNPDSTDTRQHYVANNNVRISYSPTDTAPEDTFLKSVFPFYNEPMDVRITVFGSVSENYAASQSDQQAWMAHWGFIPAYYGSTDPLLNQNNQNALPAVQVPDSHLMVHDPYNPNYEPGNLVAGLDTTLDYRTPIESLKAAPNVNAITPDLNPFKITRGLRLMYDPAFAMPYYHPTDVALSPDTFAAMKTRKLRALRSITTNVAVPNGTGYRIVQVLPAIPRLPVCSDYTYAGDSEQLIGSDPLDTDNI